MSFGPMYRLLRLYRNQWLAKEELQQLQEKKLRRIIKHAHENVTYYHRLFDSVGIRPEDVRSNKDLQCIPVTSRKRIQRLPTDEIVAKDVVLSGCYRVRTSGSTGIPLDVVKTKKRYQLSTLVFMRSLLANRYRLTDKQVIFEIPRNRPRYWFQSLGIMKQKYISCFDNLETQVKQVRQLRPDFIRGFPSSLQGIAEEIRKRGIEDVSPRGVVTGGELFDPKTRGIIESVFRQRVVDFYNSHECGNIAWECGRHEGYHINIDSLVVEIVNNGKLAKPGEKGEVVLTSLDSYAMPLIRYGIGDIGIYQEGLCSCGRGLPLLKSIEGRTNDLIALSDATIISPSEITYALRFVPGVLEFRVLQKRIDDFLVQLKVEWNFTKQTIVDRVRREMMTILGRQSNIEIQILDEIPRDPSGKLRSVVSNIGSNLSKNV